MSCSANTRAGGRRASGRGKTPGVLCCSPSDLHSSPCFPPPPPIVGISAGTCPHLAEESLAPASRPPLSRRHQSPQGATAPPLYIGHGPGWAGLDLPLIPPSRSDWSLSPTSARGNRWRPLGGGGARGEGGKKGAGPDPASEVAPRSRPFLGTLLSSALRETARCRG